MLPRALRGAHDDRHLIADDRVILRFGAVDYAVRVWVNGCLERNLHPMATSPQREVIDSGPPLEPVVA